MTLTTRSNLFVPEILQDAVKGQLAGMTIFNGNPACIVNSSLPQPGRGGQTVTVPYFGTLGELEDVAEGVALTPAQLTMSNETATIARAGKSFELTTWGAQAAAFADPYAEGARQIVESVRRRIDKSLIDAAAATSGLPGRNQVSVFSTSSPKTLDYDTFVNAKMAYGDEQDEIACVAMHSKVFGDLLKLKDSYGRPLLTDPNQGGLNTFMGVPVKVSDRMPVDLTNITAAGTTPPTVTISGTATPGVAQLKIVCTTGGSLGAGVVKFSTDGGMSYTTGVTTGASVVLTGTGLTAAFGSGTYATDNTWTAVPSYTSLLLKRNSLVAWYNGNISTQVFHDVNLDADICAVHLYYVSYRYSRLPGHARCGVVALTHN